MMMDFTPVRAGFWSLLVLLLSVAFSPAANAQVDTDLSTGGGVRIGWTADTCAAGIAGAIRYNSASSGTVDLCNGSNWITVGPGSGGTPAGATREIQFNSGGAFAASSNFKYMADGDFLLAGTFTGTASVPVTGAGTRMFFDTQKGAFRAGRVTGTQWDNANIGDLSVAIGDNTVASNTSSVAMGWTTTASGQYSTAMGNATTASGHFSTAMGTWATSSGDYSVAMGDNAVSSGSKSVAMGTFTTASGVASTAMGASTTASSNYSTAMGGYTIAAGDYGMAAGREVNVTATGDGSFGFGLTTTSPATDPQVSGAQSFGIFMGNHSGVNFSSANTMGLFGGKMVIDPAVPATQLTARGVIDAGAATDAIVFPSGTTAQRPGTPVNGMTRYNSTTSKFEAYQAGAWVDMIGGGGSSTFLSLTDTPATYAGAGGYFLKVNSGATAVARASPITVPTG
ncbi:MAG: hypothetical protein HYU57_06360 [Micavibrio aeruginosavorus]|nr:hypothetical protein [Micavibrio aeruginosavorus]